LHEENRSADGSQREDLLARIHLHAGDAVPDVGVRE
jgi:hypothetical protein